MRPVLPARAVRGEPDLGANVYVFTPSMPQSQVQSTVNSIANQQVSNQFGTQRYTLLFEPGTYGTPSDPLIFQVGYYEQVAGLGATPGAVVINGTVDVYNQCFAANNCIALDNFWRSLSNLTINVAGGTGCQTNTEFWAVSQAAPLRRVDINGGVSFMDYCNGSPDFASGGFVADSDFTGGSIVNGSQQQFVVRNSDLDGWSNGVWNQVFSGDNGAAGPGVRHLRRSLPIHHDRGQPGHRGAAVPLHHPERRLPGIRARDQARFGRTVLDWRGGSRAVNPHRAVLHRQSKYFSQQN